MSKLGHFLVPEHKIMSRSAIDALLAKMNLGLANLPKIHASDPQVKEIGAKPGDVLEIGRKDFGKKSSYYRLVVPEA